MRITEYEIPSTLFPTPELAVPGRRVLCCAGWVDLCPPPGHHAPPPPLVQVAGPPSVGATNGATGSAIHHPDDSGYPV